MKKLFINKGMVAMFATCFAAAIIAGFVAKACGLTGWTIPAVAYGVSSIILVAGGGFLRLFQKEGGPEAGAVGVFFGTAAACLI